MHNNIYKSAAYFFSMRYFKKLGTLLFLVVFIQACVIINTSGFYSGYSKLSESEKASVVFTESEFDICGLKNDENIYAINGTQLIKCISANNKSLVYLWASNCTSEQCYPLDLLQKYCIDNNITLFIVSEYYDSNKMKTSIPKRMNYPLFSINEKYYKTKYCNKYSKLFIEEMLVNQVYNSDDIYSRFFIFENGILTGVKLQL